MSNLEKGYGRDPIETGVSMTINDDQILEEKEVDGKRRITVEAYVTHAPVIGDIIMIDKTNPDKPGTSILAGRAKVVEFSELPRDEIMPGNRKFRKVLEIIPD